MPDLEARGGSSHGFWKTLQGLWQGVDHSEGDGTGQCGEATGVLRDIVVWCGMCAEQCHSSLWPWRVTALSQDSGLLWSLSSIENHLREHSRTRRCPSCEKGCSPQLGDLLNLHFCGVSEPPYSAVTEPIAAVTVAAVG